MKTNNLVFSGYVKCKHCHKAKKIFQVHGVCSDCKRREFDYGVLHLGEFMDYRQLKERVTRGQTFIDGTHQGLAITSTTFGLKQHAVKQGRKPFK